MIEINILRDLIVSDLVAKDAIVKYCINYDFSIPFSFVHYEKIYAQTKDLKALYPNNFIQNRSNHKHFLKNLGCLVITDSSLRAKITSDHRLLTSWLHNPRGVAAIMLSHSYSFREYIEPDLNRFTKKISLSFLDDLYTHELSKYKNVAA